MTEIIYALMSEESKKDNNTPSRVMFHHLFVPHMKEYYYADEINSTASLLDYVRPFTRIYLRGKARSSRCLQITLRGTAA